MHSPYLLLPVGGLCIFLYLFTFLLGKIGVIKPITHRKIWNVLLLLTFLVTVILGLILTIQANYKLKIPLLKQLLIWHVDFGIGMTIIGIFHFFWHWGYYINLFRSKKPLTNNNINIHPIENGVINIPDASKIRILVFVLGFTTIVSQVVLLREFMLVFNGNELIIGMILALWMILTGCGAFLGRFSEIKETSRRVLTTGYIFLGILPLMAILFINVLKNLVFEPGLTFGIIKILYSSTVLLLPFCLLSGFLFTYLAAAFSYSSQKKEIDKTYAYESLGSIAGGIIFSFFMANYLNSFQILTIVLAINIISVFGTLKHETFIKYTSAGLCIALVFVSFLVNFDKFAKQFLYINQELKYSKDTPFGNLAVTDYGGQLNFFENNVLLFTTENVIANEEAVHYAMIQRTAPENVLLISGGISGITNEIQKYRIRNLDYLELNPWLFKIGKEYTSSLNNKNIRIIQDDARIFIRKTEKKYGVILIHLPEPVTAQINRYYTLEFYTELKKVLTGDGIISFTLPSTANYISKEAVELNSTIFNTVRKVFKHVLIFQGEKNYFVASDSALKLNIAEDFDIKSIDNSYMNKYYLDDELIKQHSDYITSSLDNEAKINRDYFPVSYFKQINLWMSQFTSKSNIVPVLLFFIAALFLFFLYKSKPANVGMFSAGFTASSLEFIIIMVFQVTYGYVYQVMGVFFAVFMGGLTAGALMRKRLIRSVVPKNLILLQVILISITLIALPWIELIKLITLYKFLVFTLCFILLFTVAFVVGMYFSVSSVLQEGTVKAVAGKVYGIDLIGSALGAFFTSAVLLPLSGIPFTIIITIIFGLINLTAILLKKQPS